MSDARERFFDTRELIDHLARFLANQDLAHLALTSRKLSRQFTPSLYRTVDKLYHRTKINLFRFQALARNIRYPRNLTFAVNELAFCYNCVPALEEMTSQNADVADTQISSRPSWLPPSDIRTSLFIAMPLMTHLTQLTIYPDASACSVYSTPSAKDTRAMAARICWLISTSPSPMRLNLGMIFRSWIFAVDSFSETRSRDYPS